MPGPGSPSTASRASGTAAWRSGAAATGTAAFVCIFASQRNGTLDTGSTTNLARRVWKHRTGAGPGFTRDDGVTLRVRSEGDANVAAARQSAHALKRWRRAWTIALIEAMNPARRDPARDLDA